jgi:ethanolamine utilization cobalamin adenosyltransferase
MASTTCLNADQYVEKTHPRIALRGMIDALEAEVVLIQTLCRHKEVFDALSDVTNILHALMRAEVLGETVAPCRIGGKTLARMHALSHNPPGGHRSIDPADGELCARLNLLRTHVRAAELAAYTATADQPDIAQTLNELSGAVYTLLCSLRDEQFLQKQREDCRS